MLSHTDLLVYFENADAETLKQQIIKACANLSDGNQNNKSIIQFLNEIYSSSLSTKSNEVINQERKCYLIQKYIEKCMNNEQPFNIELVHLINSFLISIPDKSLLFHLDFSNYDTMDIHYNQNTNEYYLKSIKSVHRSKNIIFKSLDDNNYPLLNYKYGYITFDNQQILVSQNVFNLWRNQGITIIILFRCITLKPDHQQFIVNFGNGYAATYTNMEIGINAGCDPDYSYNPIINGHIGIHSGRGLALISFDNDSINGVIKENEWYLYTMFVKSNTNIEYYINGSDKPTNTISQWKGALNTNTAPFDIGGRIDGNWVINTVNAHNQISCDHTHCNCFYYGDIAQIMVYDRIISKKEKKQIEEPLISKYNLK